MNTELIKIDSEFPVLSDSSEALEAIQANLAGEQIDRTDLDRIKVPGSGATSWQIDGAEGEHEEKEISGVIIHHKVMRAYWQRSRDDGGGNEPPDCASEDAITGHGTPGGECAACPMARWGSARKGNGQACKKSHLLFLLRPGDYIPSVVQIPPSSLKRVKKYLLGLGRRGRRFDSVLTALRLEREVSRDGNAFARVIPSVEGILEPETVAKIQSYAELIRPNLELVRLDHRDEALNLDSIDVEE